MRLIPLIGFRAVSATVVLCATLFNTTAIAADAGALARVRSFEFVLGANTDTPGIYPLFANSRADLIIFGGGSYDSPLNRAAADPTGTKLLIGYLDISEAAAYISPSIFATAPLPSWVGKVNPGYPGLYSVQFWNPAWKAIVFDDIDTIVTRGYDGVFLDVLDGDHQWQAGNLQGNPIFPTATAEMVAFIGEIRAHVAAKFPSRTFFLIGNNPSGIATANPAALKNLDAIFNELVYYGQPPNNGFTSVYLGTENANYQKNMLAPLYGSAGVPVFGCDYPLPLTDRAAVRLSFDYYASLGWVPSVTTAYQTQQIFTTGPFMFMAVPSNSTVTGYPDFVNYLTGGQTANATLRGGNKGDYFLGGPGQNNITGGSGDDTIYAHPVNAIFKDKLTLELSATVTGNATTPAISIAVNGIVVVPKTTLTALTALTGTTTQKFSVHTDAFPTIDSLVLTVSNCSFIDQSNCSNVRILDANYNGASLDRTKTTISNGGATGAAFVYSNNGTVTFPATLFAAPSPFLANTSDTIDGGGGTNTVVYRGNYADYRVTKNADGSWLVTSRTTAEGPDTVRNVQKLVFADQQIALTGGYSGSPIPRLSNVSVRSTAGSDTQTLIGGFVITGTGNKSVLVRGIGPTLGAFGVAGFLVDPTLTLVNSAAIKFATNSGWGGAADLAGAFASVGAFALTANSGDPALLRSLAPGAYTAQITSTGGASGVVLLEIYDADATDAAGRFVNLSARSTAGRDAQTLIAGFAVRDGEETVLIRGIGPGLNQFGLTGTLAAPQLTLFDSGGTVIATNTGWTNPTVRGTSAAVASILPVTAVTFANVGAFALPANSTDAAIAITLPPGSYTAQIVGVGGTTGVALIEVYELP